MMPVTTQAVATTVSTNQPAAIAALSQPNPITGIEDEQGQPMVLTTSFIRQQINMGLDDFDMSIVNAISRNC